MFAKVADEKKIRCFRQAEFVIACRMLLKVLLLQTMIALCAAQPLHALPKQVAPVAVALQQQAGENGMLVWHTAHYRITSPTEIKGEDLKRIAQIAETITWVVKNETLPLYAPPPGERALIAIYPDTRQYEAAGGYAGTAGSYEPRKSCLFLNGSYYFESAPRAGSRLTPVHNEDLLVHEMVHLCMHRYMGRLPAWVAEGFAEYYACMHTRAGNFSFANPEMSIRDHLRDRYRRDDPTVFVRAVAEIAPLHGRAWLDLMAKLAEKDRYQAYAIALLMIHYHLHGGEVRRGSIVALLEEAAKQERFRPIAYAVDGPVVGAALQQFWKPRGLQIQYPVADKAP